MNERLDAGIKPEEDVDPSTLPPNSWWRIVMMVDSLIKNQKAIAYHENGEKPLPDDGRFSRNLIESIYENHLGIWMRGASLDPRSEHDRYRVVMATLSIHPDKDPPDNIKEWLDEYQGMETLLVEDGGTDE